MKYLLAIDQSTSNTKAMLFDGAGEMAARCDLPHRQIISENGWVEHDPTEIYQNLLEAVRRVFLDSGIDRAQVAACAICNQRETSLVWHAKTGEPLWNAVVWQCPRGEAICAREPLRARAKEIEEKTGLPLSPYFSAAKLCWILENAPRAKAALREHAVCCGTMDSFLVWKLTGGRSFKTDYSNASRTQLLNLETLDWDEGVCALFGITRDMLPELCGSDALYGETDFEGIFDRPIPIHAVMGDSHASLFGHGCQKGMCKASYGTGSAVMIHIGAERGQQHEGIATSIAWSMGGRVEYINEVNVMYSCAVMKWVVEEVGLLSSAKEAGPVALSASPEDETYLVPAFTGLGAPYYDSNARASFVGMSRCTGRAELVRAAEDCIAYQITDAIDWMCRASGVRLSELHADGGGSKDRYLLQMQSDLLGIPVAVSHVTELSALGAARMAGIALGLYSKDGFEGSRNGQRYLPRMDEATRERKLEGWHSAVRSVMAC